MKSLIKMTATSLLALYLILAGNPVGWAQGVKDINGKDYKTCKIGLQVWLSENLNVDRFRNGDPIPQAQSNEEWVNAGKAKQPAWCYYANDTANGRKYGRLYNFYALTDPRGLAPQGWHIPNTLDWAKLVRVLGGVDVAGIKMKSPAAWNETIKGTNKSGFTATPGGFRTDSGEFQEMDNKGQWWTSNGDIGSGAQIWSVGLNSSTVQLGYFRMNKESGLSIRCVKE